MPPHARLTSDGHLKVKVPGRKSKLYKVPFLDRFRRRAFRSLRHVVKQLDFKVLGEELLNRRLDVEFDGRTIKVEVKDTILLTKFAPTPDLVKDHPALKKPAYIVTFMYNGKGSFNTLLAYNKKGEHEAFRDFFARTVCPLYISSFLNDTAHEKETKLEKGYEDVMPKLHGEIGEPEGLKAPVAQKLQVAKPRELKEREETRGQLESPPINPQTEPSIEEVKKTISSYNPRTFREHLALERYREALTTSPDKEEEIHTVFYSLINGEKSFKDFYRQLYPLAPKLIERLKLL